MLPDPALRPRSQFFPIMAALLLLAVVLGFSRTFFLKPWFPSEPLPTYLIVHGVVLTAWFAFFVMQTLLVARGSIQTHRRVGKVGAVLAVLVVAMALVAVFEIVTRFRGQGIDVEAGRGQIAFIVWGNLAALAAFATFIARGIVKRNNADAHKRLMLLGSLSIMSPAFIRISAMPPFDRFPGVLFTLGALLLTLAALVIHDMVTLRRVHRETLWGVPYFLVLLLGAAFLMPGTPVDEWLLAMMW